MHFPRLPDLSVPLSARDNSWQTHFARLKHFHGRILPFLLLGACFTVTKGQDKPAGASRLASYTGSFSSADVEIRIEPDVAGLKAKLQYKAAPYTAKATVQGDSAQGEFTDGIDSWPFTLTPISSGLEFQTGSFRSNLDRKTDLSSGSDTLQAQPVAGSPSAVEKASLQVSSDKREYAHGDVMQISVEVPQDGFLRLYGVSADGSTSLLFPNKWVRDDKVAKGKIVLPGADAVYDFMLALNEGQTKVTESVHAVFSSTPFADSGKDGIKFGSATFEGLGTTNNAQRSTRGLTPTARVKAFSVETKYDLNR